MRKQTQLISSDQAVKAKKQHTKPCSDCPWARTALPGWLGGGKIEDWLMRVHSEELIMCHTLIGAQCAGASIYRANVCKVPKSPDRLRLPSNTKLVFVWDEFKQHHNKKLKHLLTNILIFMPTN